MTLGPGSPPTGSGRAPALLGDRKAPLPPPQGFLLFRLPSLPFPTCFFFSFLGEGMNTCQKPGK